MTDRKASYHLDSQNRFVVDNYQWAVPFANFFPGIAGLWGIPLWIYYVSRGQAVCSLGVRDKDHQILEFLSFNRACESVPHEGFRTFMRLDDKSVVEPFRRTDSAGVHQRLLMSTGELELNEQDDDHGLETHVVYYPLVNLPVAGLVREVTLRNTGSSTRRVECLDGVPRILPYGMNQQHIKFIARHIEAMMGVHTIGGAPLFRLKQTAADSEKVGKLSGGNFYFGFADSGNVGRFVVDPQVVFRDPFHHHEPWGLRDQTLDQLLSLPQLVENATPCAFTPVSGSLDPGQTMRIVSVLGNVDSDARLEELLALVKKPGALEAKRLENRDTLDRITSLAFTASTAPTFDQYCSQDFLDNAMRGGMPLVFEGNERKSVFYVYCRQNGDLERDYHYFVLEPTYLSQGTGHYRSIYQNRRTDAWFFPEIGDANIRWFMNLTQLDGYNPLEVNGLTYSVRDPEGVERLIRTEVKDSGLADRLIAMTQRPFTPGEFIMAFEQGGRRSGGEYEGILGELLARCEENEIGGLHEGFWVDHFLYNLDTIEVYLMVFPDRLQELLLGNREYTFFDDPDVVLPRSEKSVQREDGKVRRYGAVVRDTEKIARARARTKHPYRVRTRYGEGEVYHTCLLVKLLCLFANRMATLDFAGVGLEMEADKPGWNDSMNGLPGLFGSSLCESLELQHLGRFLSESLQNLPESDVALYEELADFVDELGKAIEQCMRSNDSDRRLVYWNESNGHKEAYREQTKLGVSGHEKLLTTSAIKAFVDSCLEMLNPVFDGTSRSSVMNADGVPHTYFVNEVTEFEPTDRTSHQGYPLVTPKRFQQRPVPLFLEGPMHFLKVHPEQARDVYEAVRRSPLFDKKLKMYKSCENMQNETYELGRAVGAYPRGWLENESIYLHMEYKYLLEVLHSGLVDRFYDDIRSVLVPFHDPAVYGRSTLEGASFIVSSAYADSSLHGRGFQARLSGITVEMLHMWILMVAGAHPFHLDDQGKLALTLSPALAGWLFTEKAQTRTYQDEKKGRIDIELPANSFAFKFLGSTLVVYHNAKRKDTYGEGGVHPTEVRLTYRDGKEQVVSTGTLGMEAARAVRERQVERMDIVLS